MEWRVVGAASFVGLFSMSTMLTTFVDNWTQSEWHGPYLEFTHPITMMAKTVPRTYEEYHEPVSLK